MAAGQPSYQIVGAHELQRALDNLADRVGDPELAEKAAGPFVDAARDRAPRRTGALAGTIRAEPLAGRDGLAGAVILAGGPDVPYAGVIEYGWPDRNIAPAGYLAGTPAELALDRYAGEVADLVRRFDREAP